MSAKTFFCSAISAALIALIMLLSGSHAAYANPDSTMSESFVAPTPVGGMEALAANIVYPSDAKRDGVEGKVMVEVVIGADGKVKSATVKTGVREDLDKAATYAVCLTKWTAPLKNGVGVDATVMVPVVFKLGEKGK